MNTVLAIGWTAEELANVSDECNDNGIAITAQYGSENLSSYISQEFGLVIINGSKHIETHQKVTSLLHNCGVETVVFLNERQGLEAFDETSGPYILRTAPLTHGKIKQCLKNAAYRNERRLYEQASLGDFKQFLKLFQKSVSHEFNTPINVIKTSLHILKSYRAKLSQEETSEQIDFIAEATERMERLISDIRFDMDLTNKGITPNIGQLDISQAIENATSSLQEKARVTQHPSPEPIHALADSHLLTQAIARVTQNGLENSDGKIDISISESNEWIRIDISDTGYGIDNAISSRIFEPFTRYGDENGKQGIGLGLPITRKCMIAMQGRVDFISQTGKGTTFSLYLPARSTESASL